MFQFSRSAVSDSLRPGGLQHTSKQHIFTNNLSSLSNNFICCIGSVSNSKESIINSSLSFLKIVFSFLSPINYVWYTVAILTFNDLLDKRMKKKWFNFTLFYVLPFFMKIWISDLFYFPTLCNTSSHISFKAALQATNSLNFCLSESLYFSFTSLDTDF